MKTRFALSILLIALLAWPALAGPPAQPLAENAGLKPVLERLPIGRAAGDPVDFAAALAAGAAYLQGMQADVTDDNAGNGFNGAETPEDPDDAGWDWSVNLTAPLHHTTAASELNLYGATAQGLLAAYGGGGGGGGCFIALTDAANAMLASASIRTSSDMIVLMEYDDLPAVSGTAYADAARAKYDARIAAFGSATAFAQNLRDVRGASYPNGIIGWDLGAYAKVAAMLDARYPGNGYGTQAADIAEVLYQDSFMDNPGLFDIVDDAGWDPTWSNVNFWWYSLGLSGLIDAFHASGTHTTEIPGLVARLETSTFSNGAVSGSYGAHPTDEDWQSTAYVAMSLAYLDQVAYQADINRMAYWIGATQNVTGAWVYSDGNHYPEIGGECTAALALGQAPATLLVDDGFLSQTEVDAYNAAHSTAFVLGYDAFASIQPAVNAAATGASITVLAGTYTEQLHIAKSGLAIAGAGVGATIVKSPASLPAYFTTGGGTPNYPVVFVDGASGVALSALTIDGDHQGIANYRFSGLAFWNAGGSLSHGRVLNVMDAAFSGGQHGVGVYAYNDTGGPYTIALNDVDVLAFQKTAVALSGTGLTVDLDDVTTIGEGPTGVNAQNGIQIGYGASGTLNDCDISLVDWTGGTWTATGLLLQEAGTVTATNVDIDACQTSVYWIDSNGSYTGGTITNPVGDAYYAYSSGTAKSGNHPRVAAQPLTEDYKAFGGRSAVTAAVTNSTITGRGLANSWGVTAFSEADGPVYFTVSGCTISHWDWGVVCYDFDTTLNDVIFAEIHDNDIVDNTSYGVYAHTSNTQDAEGNWWGHASGPYHLTANPFGQGDPVSDHVDFDPFDGQAALGITASTNGPINCSQSSTLTFRYTPDTDTPALRGYSLRVPKSLILAFTQGDFHANSALFPVGPGSASSFFDVTLSTDGLAYLVDYGILGATPGITMAVDLFTLVADGAATGAGVVRVETCSLRDLTNQPIGGDCSDAETILVDCTAPTVPTMTAEPTFTQGLANTVSWSDESGSGAVEYYAECATDVGFGTVIANTGWIAGLSHNFTGLSDATPYWYRVKARDALDNETGWSTAVSSTQDDTPPATSASALTAYQNSLTFDVAWTGSDATSGLATVALWYDNGGGWTSFGSSASSPIGFTAPSDGSYGFYTVGTDVVGNLEGAPGVADATTIVDATFPLGTFAINGGAGYTHLLAVTLNSAITDANPLEMRFSNDGASWSDWTAYAAIQAWTLQAGSDGLRTVYAEFRDAAQNALPLSDTIAYDTTAPGMASAINAEPRHEEVYLTWTNPGDADLAGLEIWRACWHDGALNSAYPEYDDIDGDVFPDRPADRANADFSPEWSLVHTALPTATSYTDPETARGIYIYEIFPVDLAGNYGPRAATGNDYATNYWLGDVHPVGAWDGNVDLPGDIQTLALAYGTVHGGTGYDNDCDVGPTTHPTGSGFGIPTTDNLIGFEDLMIFALNYHSVAPMPLVQGSAIAMLNWFRREDGAWSLALSEPCANLKALHLTAGLPADVTVELEAGSLLSQQASPVFLKQVAGEGLDVSLALMGQGAVITGQGVLFTVLLPAGVLPGAAELIVRDAANADLEFALSATEVVDLPTTYRFVGNFPNPFNPKTAIAFDLPEAQDVQLIVFGADGRRVATLLDARMPAGRQVAVWDGRDDTGLPVASGVYFCRIVAGPLNETHKMLLLK